MKAFICALILFIAVTAGSFIGSITVTRITDDISKQIQALPAAKEGAELDEQKDILTDIFAQWEDVHFLMKILVNHPIKSTIDEQFRVAIGYCQANDAKEYTAAVAALENSLHLLREVSEISLGNIL